MPRKSSGTVSAQSVSELGLPGRAVSALTRAGIVAVEDLATLTRAELGAIPGLGAGMVAAIREVVPEPVGSIPRAVEEQESPAAPSIPSFASLRDTRRRSAADLFMPRQLELPEEIGTPEPEPVVDRRLRPAPPRPPEWADLWNLGLHLARWWVQQPVRTVRRLLG